MNISLKLYKVKLRGLSSPTGIGIGTSYVIADTAEEAYQRVRKWLDKKDYGFAAERELESITLLAEDKEYTNVGTMLFMPSYK